MSNKGLDELMEGSWEKMAIILDKEMPVRKRRRWIIPILFFLVSGIGFAVYSVWRVQEVTKNEKSEPAINNHTLPMAGIDLLNSNVHNLKFESEHKNLIPENFISHSKSKYSNTHISNLIENQINNSNFAILNESNFANEEISISSKTNSSDLKTLMNQENISEYPIQLLRVKTYHESIQSEKIATPEISLISHVIAINKKQNQTRSIRNEINWTGGIQYTSLGKGYSIKSGPEFKWNLNKRYSVSVGFVPEYRAGTYLLSDYKTAGEIIKTIDSFRILNPMAEFDVFESSSSKLNSASYQNRSNLFYLNVPLHFHWQAHSRINLGIGLNYQLLFNRIDKIQGPIYLINTEENINETRRFYRQVVKPSFSLNYSINPKLDLLLGFEFVPELRAVNSERVKDSTGSVTPNSLLVDYKQSQWNCFLGIKYGITSF